VKGDPIPMQLIDTRKLPVEENLWLAQLDNRLDHNGARRIIRELDRENRADRMAAHIDAVYTANFEVMEEVSRMSDTTMVFGKTLENAGYVTRKMMQADEKARAEIVQNALAQGIPIETVAAITGLDIEKVRGISKQGAKSIK
jgi:ribosomal protein S17E